MCFYLVRQDVQYFLLNSTWVLADLQKVMRVGSKTGDIGSIFEYLILTLSILVVQVLSYLEMMNLFVNANRNRVILHIDITT